MERNMKRSGTCILPYANKFRLILMTSEALPSLQVHCTAKKKELFELEREESPVTQRRVIQTRGFSLAVTQRDLITRVSGRGAAQAQSPAALH